MAEYYVRASGGNDANTGLTFGDAFATIAYAESVTVGGDTVYICADGIHYPPSSISINSTATTTSSISYIGANSIGVVDGTKAVVYGAATRASTFQFSATIGSYVFKNLDITGTDTTQYGIWVSSSGTNAKLTCIDCNIYGFTKAITGAGVFVTNAGTSSALSLINCNIYNNNIYGVYSRHNVLNLITCNIYNNLGDGLYIYDLYGKVRVSGCNFYRNGNDAIHINSAPSLFATNNVFAFNSASGIYIPNGAYCGGYIFYNNIYYKNTDYGIYTTEPDINQFHVCNKNCSFGNGLGNININSDVLPGVNNIYVDPLFVNDSIGVEDFRLQVPASPCLNIGYGYNG